MREEGRERRLGGVRMLIMRDDTLGLRPMYRYGLLTWTDRFNDRFGFGNLDMEL